MENPIFLENVYSQRSPTTSPTSSQEWIDVTVENNETKSQVVRVPHPDSPLHRISSQFFQSIRKNRQYLASCNPDLADKRLLRVLPYDHAEDPELEVEGVIGDQYTIKNIYDTSNLQKTYIQIGVFLIGLGTMYYMNTQNMFNL